MKIALVAAVDKKSSGATSWIGLGYLYSALKREHEVEILYYTFDQIDSAAQEIVDNNFDLVGISVLQFNCLVSMHLCELIKSKNPSIYTVVGNIVPTLYPNEFLKKGNVDFVIFGEGERIFLELCQLISSNSNFEKCHGIAYLQNGTVIRTSKRDKIFKLDQLNFPERLPNNTQKTAFGIIGSRGCDGTCTFCDSKVIHGNIVRTRSMENIIQEVRELVENKGCKVVSFYDSTFCTKSDKSLDRLRQLYEHIQNSGLHFQFDLNMRSEQFHDDLIEVIEKLHSVGLFCLLIGFEAGNDLDLKLYGKPASVKDHYAALNALRKLDFYQNDNSLYIDYGFINFNPYTTIQRLQQNKEFLSKSKLDVTFPKLASRLLISGGAPICKKIANDGLLKTPISSILLDPFGYNFEHEEIQGIYDLIRYCVEIFPNTVNTEFMPHFILFKNYIGDSNLVSNFKYYREFMEDYSIFSLELFDKILYSYKNVGGIKKEEIQSQINLFLEKNNLIMKRISAYQMKIYMYLKKSKVLLNY